MLEGQWSVLSVQCSVPFEGYRRIHHTVAVMSDIRCLYSLQTLKVQVQLCNLTLMMTHHHRGYIMCPPASNDTATSVIYRQAEQLC